MRDGVVPRQPNGVRLEARAHGGAREPVRLFDLRLVDVHIERRGDGDEAHHQLTWERPRLRRVIADVRETDANLLEHLARRGALEGLTWLDEAGEARVHARRRAHA